MSHEPAPRSIPMVEPVFCGICRWPVQLYTAGRSVVLIEHRKGHHQPHRCPQAAIDRYEAAERVRAFIRGGRVVADHEPGRGIDS